MKALVSLSLVVLLSACATQRASPLASSSSDTAAPAAVLHTSAPPKTPEKRAPKDVTLVIAVEGLGLFEEEQRAAEELVASWAENEGLRVVPLARARQAFARARKGQHPETGAACGRPLSSWRAVRRWQQWLGAEGKLRASVGCDAKAKTCALDVSAYDDVAFGGEELLQQTAPFDPSAGWQEALPAALAALKPVPEGGGGGGLGGLLGALGGGVVEARPEKLGFRAWPAREPDLLEGGAFEGALTFRKGTSPLRACFEQDRGGAELLIDVDSKGRVARCSSREADDDLSQCACAAFSKHASAQAPLRGKRAYVGVSFEPADVVTATNAVARASVRTYLEQYKKDGNVRWRPSVSHRSIEEWRAPPDTAFARCFADATEHAPRHALVTVRFDERGGVSSVELDEQEGKRFTHEQAACVQRAFATAQAPCPAVAATSARAELHVSFRVIGEERSPAGLFK